MSVVDPATLNGFERALIKALWESASDGLQIVAEIFLPPNRKIASVTLSLTPSQRHLLAVQEALGAELEKVGGPAHLTEIQCETISPEIVQWSFDCVMDAYREREAIRIFKDSAAGKATTDDVRERLNALYALKNLPASAVAIGFPDPPADDAFYGLAGDIVRRIEPHTEASNVALLIQTLGAFGNIIGRFPFMMADGARHCMNLFWVLVGESAKSRKGTSLSHSLRFYECVEHDEKGWRKMCVSHGLATGEGLIHAVRDATTKKGSEDQSEEETTDAGVTDKRLFVVEEEFARVLKVMAREGNILSAVIRCAWDTGDLRSMTKSAPSRATGAHISIGGHITLDELRRNLTETDQANGFGNRFLWLAVKRSKILSRGGDMRPGSNNDLINRLMAAVKFAKYQTEITRSEEAWQLWDECYPTLSEGKPGLLGGVTSRAEAQVMRLSAIYALLDQSALIQPAHHRAAMALWDYCERSAEWIFVDRYAEAETILARLREAGQAGLTRNEIRGVFSGHLESDKIDRALETLKRSGVAVRSDEATKGRPIERWRAVT